MTTSRTTPHHPTPHHRKDTPMRYTSPLSPRIWTGPHGVEWRVPPLALAAIVRQIAESLRDDDDMASDLLTAANTRPHTIDDYEATFAVLRRAGLDHVEVVYPRTSDTADLLAHEAGLILSDIVAGGPVDHVVERLAVRTAYVQDDDAATYRLCSSCHRLASDCHPGTPTTCAECSETRTR